MKEVLVNNGKMKEKNNWAPVGFMRHWNQRMLSPFMDIHKAMKVHWQGVVHFPLCLCFINTKWLLSAVIGWLALKQCESSRKYYSHFTGEWVEKEET